MPHFVDIKKRVKKDILIALDKAGELDLKKTVCQFSLDTGFTEKTINQIVDQMNSLNYIIVDGDTIKRPAG